MSSSFHRSEHWQYLFRQGYEVSIIPEIVAPADSEVYHKGDTIDFAVEWTMTYGTGQEIWIEEYQINSADYPPGIHMFKAEGWGGSGAVYDSISLCIFDFWIRENLTKKYFNPLKPDSARVVYQILPDQYANPDLEPNPIKMEVEIRDKDSVLVYGPRFLTTDEQRTRVLFWDGKDNGGQLANPAGSPFEVALTLTYQSSGRAEKDKIVKTNTNSRMLSIVALFVEDDIQILKDDFKTTIWDPIFAREYDKVTGELKILKELQPFGDEVFMEDAGNNGFKYTLKYKIKYFVDAFPSKDVYGEPKLKYEFKLTDPGGAANVAAVIAGEKVGWEGIIEYNKEVALPNHQDFTKHPWTLSIEYKYPKDGAQIIDKETFSQNMKVFFLKGITPPWFDYDWDFEPNWFEYWGELSFVKQEPYMSTLTKYDHTLIPVPVPGPIQISAGQYRPMPPWYDEQHYYLGPYAALEGPIIDDDNVTQLAYFYGIHLYAHVCRHERQHMHYFLEWWTDWADWEARGDIAGFDRDLDLIPNDKEAEFGLNPDLRDSDGDELNDFEEIVYRHHAEWVLEIKNDLKWKQNDWAEPGKQTKVDPE